MRSISVSRFPSTKCGENRLLGATFESVVALFLAVLKVSSKFFHSELCLFFPMATKRPVESILAAVVGALLSTAVVAADWNSCADDLGRLRRAARDAADVAEQIKSKESDLENCRRFPNTFDLMRDSCKSYASDYESEVSSLQSELDTVESRVRDVSYSCGVDLGSVRSSAARPSSGNQLCDLYRRYKGRLPDSKLLQTCKKSMPEQDCRKCLAN